MNRGSGACTTTSAPTASPTASTRTLLGATHGQIWFTETGGVVARHNHSAHDFPESAAHAGQVTRFVFNRLVPLSPRIARVYLYQWSAGVHRRESWDSGLIGPHGTPRPAFWVLVQELHKLGQLALHARRRGAAGEGRSRGGLREGRRRRRGEGEVVGVAKRTYGPPGEG